MAGTAQIKEIIEENRALEAMIDKEIREEEESENQLNAIMQELLRVVAVARRRSGTAPSPSSSCPRCGSRCRRRSASTTWWSPKRTASSRRSPCTRRTSLKYFSDYSELESLRSSLEDVFGTEDFVRAYRIIEREFETRGVASLEHDNLAAKVDFIDRGLFSQYVTLLTTLIVMESKINEDSLVR